MLDPNDLIKPYFAIFFSDLQSQSYVLFADYHGGDDCLFSNESLLAMS